MILATAFDSFLGRAPRWYKLAVLMLLAGNPLLLWVAGPTFTGWAVLLEFIFVLAMTLKCYPLQPGGLLALEAVLLGLTDPHHVYAEVVKGLPVILLLIFMVAGVYFLKDVVLFAFTRLLLAVRSRVALALLFCSVAALLSAFLDALTVMAVVIAVGAGSYAVYHRVATGRREEDEHDVADDSRVQREHEQELAEFRAFLRGLTMHAAIGTALGGVATLVGEPQNLLVGERAGWDFVEFFLRVAPVSLPVLAAGLLTCGALEKLRWFGYGAELPVGVRRQLAAFDERVRDRRSPAERWHLWVQATVALILIAALAFHVAAVGLIGLLIIVLATAFTGIVEEHRLGEAFHEALPFTALLGVFFVIVAFIDEQNLFRPVMVAVLALEGQAQLAMFYLANGALSAISDNVFVATVFLEEIDKPLRAGTLTREQFDALAVALNTGVNIPSVATPNGQAAFLFLLSSSLAPLIRLSYAQMVWMALPYFLVMSVTGLLAVLYLV
ncbi:MAG TPA: sodium/proton antiporter NhaB [Steroidobacteraceae bacterium]|nr:sodium/proton antiporter NhaB [Steroidobacteraceae bacterium]